jgi:hypothetical protein
MPKSTASPEAQSHAGWARRLASTLRPAAVTTSPMLCLQRSTLHLDLHLWQHSSLIARIWAGRPCAYA